MDELLKRFQGTLFEMYLSQKINEEEFEILAALAEGMESSNEARLLATMMEPRYLSDKALTEAIKTKEFHKALKGLYNLILARHKKAEAWLDLPGRTGSEVEKWMPEFEKIVDQLNLLLELIGEHSTEEGVNGFEI